MYLILTASKDTYVTNRKLSSNDGRYANVGKASSLDLFKLQSENKLVKPQTELLVKSIPSNGDDFVLTDTNGNTQTYTYTDVATDASNKLIGLGLAPTISDIVNETYTVINDSAQTFEAVEKSNNKIILEQKTAGFNSETSASSNTSAIELSNFSIKEFSKILLKFDYDKITQNFDITQGEDFGAKLKLFDISTGQVKPKNFSLSVYPLSKSFDEGIGRDIYSFGQAGWSNFITSSRDENTLSFNKWSLSGLRSKGSNGDLNIDIITGSNNISYSNEQLFVNGDEDLSIDITNFVSATLSNQLHNNGLVVEFSSVIDQNSNTYFVKRFGSKHLKDKFLSPRLDFFCDDTFTKPDNIIYTNNSTRIFLENKQGNFYKNLYFTGSNILDASKNQLSASLSYQNFKTSLYATQSIDSAGQQKPGMYYVDFNLDMFSQPLHGYLTGSGELEADLKWHILVDEDNSLNTLIKDTKIKISTGSNIPTTEKFLISDIRYNHNKKGTKDEKMFLVSFVDTIANLDAIKIPYRRKGENLGEVYYSVYDVNTNKELIPFESSIKGTKMSYEDGDYYFTLYKSSLFTDRQIKFKFYLKDYNNLIIENDKIFRF
jgi:hypothetical protein